MVAPFTFLGAYIQDSYKNWRCYSQAFVEDITWKPQNFAKVLHMKIIKNSLDFPKK